MKKIIALLLALIMTFSVATVAFAEGEATTEPEKEETILTDVKEFLGEYEWILDLPAGVIPPALKLAKIAFKFIKVYVKICDVFGLDPIETAKGIFEFIQEQADKYEESKGENTETTEPTTEAPAAAA